MFSGKGQERNIGQRGHFALPFAIFIFGFCFMSYFFFPQFVQAYALIVGTENLEEFVCTTPTYEDSRHRRR
ncbi:hypothetical protein MRY87_06295 [bacterium]|nr:hypothetical protein [bacterium]